MDPGCGMITQHKSADTPFPQLLHSADPPPISCHWGVYVYSKRSEEAEHPSCKLQQVLLPDWKMSKKSVVGTVSPEDSSKPNRESWVKPDTVTPGRVKSPPHTSVLK